MTDHHEYLTYLLKRSWFGKLYRRFYLYQTLRRYMGQTVLDVGCDIGNISDFYQHAHGIDINPFDVEICKLRGFSVYVKHLDTLHFVHRIYDTITLDNELEPIEDPEPLLSEGKRVLCDNGSMIVAVPGIKVYASDLDYKHNYGEVALINRMEINGLKLENLLYLPFKKSNFLSKIVRQYFIYGVFKKNLSFGGWSV